MANNHRRVPTFTLARRAYTHLQVWLRALRSNRLGVITTEYLAAVSVCALALVAAYKGYNHSLTSEVRTRVGLLSTGGAPQAIDPGINRPPSLGPRRPGTHPQQPRPCRGGTCTRENECFAAGTLVHTATGDRPIETIEVGDLVWSRDEQTGELALKSVVARFVTEDKPVIELGVEGDLGSEALTVTHGHPFWVEGEGWVDSDEIEDGALLWSPDGSLTGHRGASWGARAKVYNLEVEDFHTYFVGELHAWVHNETQCPRGLEERGVRPAPGTRRRAPYEAERRAERDARHQRGDRPTPWRDARESYWRDAAAREEAAQLRDPNYRPRYSRANLGRMRLGLAPHIRVELVDRNGNRKLCDLPIELHHTLIPQREGTDLAHEPWNLTPAPGWAHDAMDPYRHFGFELVRIEHGPATWTGRRRRSCFGN